jgi:hypothetical protein
VTFRWQHDRFGHTIELVHGQQVDRLLDSVEGTPSDNWPPSPPLQQLHVETRDTNRVGLLVGMAGKNYWSMSVEVDAELKGLFFDVACRVSASSARLATTYSIANAAGGKVIFEDGIMYRDENRGWGLTVFRDGAPDHARVRVDERELTILPSVGDSTTVRWKYCVSLGE